jgi:tRNA (mo5U34)-methyltransferase
MDGSELRRAADAFGAQVEALKQELRPGDFDWYPYNSLSNFQHLEALLAPRRHDLFEYVGSNPVLDIGAADGETAFFLESLGLRVHVLEYGPTNYNGGRGLRTLRDALESTVDVTELDLDSQFQLPGDQYGLALALGVLYHLKNPYFFLEQLALRVEHMLLSTRVARFNIAVGTSRASPEGQNAIRVDLSTIPAAYLVDPGETNNDPTNYWIFSLAGLRRILGRTSWEIIEFMTVGATDSDPATSAGDERAFCLLHSRAFHS